MEVSQYDELYIVSDLHMGGARPDFQILREAPRLAGFIEWVAQQRPDGRVGLVLDGDVIDTLAEDVGGYVAIGNAVSVVERIMDDTSFSCVWKALAGFVAKPNRTLVVVVGNHDIELAFPDVQHLVRRRLTSTAGAAGGQVEFATVGAGYACLVGGARVFCTHGNEVDAWNYVRYEDLSRVARRINSGLTFDPFEWEPNAGTKMVKDVMNEVKRRYAWIDLLKPETQAAVGVLVVLDPGQATKITKLPGIVGEFERGKREFGGRLSADGIVAPPATARVASVDQLLGPNLTAGLRGGGDLAQLSADAMLLEAEKQYRQPRVVGADSDGTLGTGGLLRDRLFGWLTGVGKEEALRRALVDWLAGDTTFDLGTRDEAFEEVTKRTGDGIDFLVTGHTHLARAIDLGNRYYFNCGTWIRLLRLTNAMLADTASFKPVYDVLVDGRLSTIDAARFAGEPFVLDDRSTAVCIKTDPRGVVGTLVSVQGTGNTTTPLREYVRK